MADQSYSSSAILLGSRLNAYRSSANLQKIETADYSTSAVLLATPQCETPGATVLPTLVSLAIQINQDSDPPVATVLPNLLTINIQTKSC